MLILIKRPLYTLLIFAIWSHKTINYCPFLLQACHFIAVLTMRFIKNLKIMIMINSVSRTLNYSCISRFFLPTSDPEGVFHLRSLESGN